MNVVFLEPSFPDNQKQFVRALAEVGATVIGIGERPKDWLDGDVAGWLADYEQVPSIVDEGRLREIVGGLQRHVEIHALEAAVEAHVMAAAHVREACGIPGTSVRTAYLCRDKPAMKEVLRAAGVRCAASTGARSGDDVRRFVAEVGFPVVLKPAAGAGASGAERVASADDLEAAIARSGVDHGAEVAVEEFVEGHEGFYDTISIDGRPAMDFATHYYPNVLEAMRTRWISPQFIATNRIDSAPGYDEVREMGRVVIAALGIGTSATHMEWFAGPKGLYFSEIGCRPPGVRCWDLYAAGNDIDIYREWASAVVRGEVSRAPSRRFAAGIIALRPDRDGAITGYDGLDEIQRRHGEWVIDVHLPGAGTPTQPVEAGYMANAWVRMRHPDYDVLRGMLDDVGRTVQVHAACEPSRRSPATQAVADRSVAGARSLAVIERLPAPPALTAAALDARLADGGAFPIVEPGRCTFAHRGAAIEVRLVHFGVGFPAELRFDTVDDSDWWLLTLAVPDGSRVEYKVEVVDSFGTHLLEDPLNTRHATHPFGANSVLEAAGYAEPPFAATDPDVARGRLVDFEHPSAALGRATLTTVYLPAGDTLAGAHRHPLLVVHDGDDYLEYASVTTVLDNLTAAGAIPPTVVAFLRPVERLVEYADDPRHADFLCTELIPTLEAELALPAGRDCRFAMGASFGAVASLAAAARHPGVFGGLLLQSGSFAGAGAGCRPRPEPLWRPVRAFVRSYLAAPARVADRVAVTCGVYESLICENRALVPDLAGTGMETNFFEALDGHNWASWRDSLGVALPWLLAR